MSFINLKRLFSLIAIAGALMGSRAAIASDHDDGEIDLKGRSLNLTDLFVFREDWQHAGGDNSKLVMIMNTNPRSLPGQQYFFSTNARYEFHISRVANRQTRPTGADDITLRFTFGDPVVDTKANGSIASGYQPVTMVTIKDGVETAATSTINSCSITDSATDAVATCADGSDMSVGTSTFKVFAGMRQDPFFFDVNGFFQTRRSLLNNVVASKFASNGVGYNAGSGDFTAYYNVNSIAVSVPMAFLQADSRGGFANTIFDVWETISIAD